MKRFMWLGIGLVMRAWTSYASPASDAAAENFIQNETQFHLGILPTEQSHPKTRGLSQVLATNPEKGMALLLSVDDDIPPVAEKVFASPEFAKLSAAVQRAKASGHHVFFSGCGATGRLSILINAAVKRYAREKGDASLTTFTADIMTGGDYALVKSVEMFEDYLSFGHQQAIEAGLAKDDVLVAISEGGETSSVIGTVLRGVEVGADTFFLFNNPPKLLADRLERCRRVIRNPAVTVLNLCTGPMAIAGSTRMQATTIELLVASAAMEQALFNRAPADTLKAFRRMLTQLRMPENLKALTAFVVFEEGLYRQHGRITYYSDDWLLDIFTDTTERSPTFKLPPFRPEGDTVSPAPWAAVKSLSQNTREAWLRVYEGEPHCLAWSPDDYIRLGASENIRKNPPRITTQDLMAFRVGNESDPSRTEVKPNAAMAILVGGEKLDPAVWAKLSAPFEQRKIFRIGPKQPGDDLAIAIDVPATPLRLFDHLALKLVLNNVSSATMGKLGRLTSNWMSFVDASNKKLIDRSTRLIVELVGVDYRTACHALYETFEEMKGWDVAKLKTVSPVAYTIEKLKNRKPAHSAAGL